jgi:hypothetical protein
MTAMGRCKLCLEDKELMDSHFLPASIYKLCRDTATGLNPIAISAGVAKHTTDQISDHVFCSDCEKRLNANGEAWVHLNSARPEGFLIRDALEKVPPAMATDSFAVYAGGAVPGIDMDQLSYFGLSIFWRAGAHRWPALDQDDKRMERLLFGKYEDPMRLFLLNSTPLPNSISLLISVWPWKNPEPPIAFHTPVGKRNENWYSYSFYIPGLDFKLVVGKAIPPILQKMSAFVPPQRYLYASEAGATEMMQSFGKVVGSSQAVGKLAREFPTKK